MEPSSIAHRQEEETGARHLLPSLYSESAKVCTRCTQVKPLSEFHVRRASPDGLAYICKACKSEEPWRKKGREAALRDQRRYLLKKNYGITVEQYDKMLERQNGVCAVCKDPSRSTRWGTLCVDHDHQTGRVRGLLCTNCNQAIGKLGDDVDMLRSAITYLEGARA